LIVAGSRGRGRGQLLLPLLLFSLLPGCKTDPQTPDTPPHVPLPTLPPTPAFDSDSAYAFVERQVAFGPRVPGTAAHRACGDWLVEKLKGYGAEVVEQTGTVTVYTGQKLPLRNIIARWNPAAKERILL